MARQTCSPVACLFLKIIYSIKAELLYSKQLRLFAPKATKLATPRENKLKFRRSKPGDGGGKRVIRRDVVRKLGHLGMNAHGRIPDAPGLHASPLGAGALRVVHKAKILRIAAEGGPPPLPSSANLRKENSPPEELGAPSPFPMFSKFALTLSL